MALILCSGIIYSLEHLCSNLPCCVIGIILLMVHNFKLCTFIINAHYRSNSSQRSFNLFVFPTAGCLCFEMILHSHSRMGEGRRTKQVMENCPHLSPPRGILPSLCCGGTVHNALTETGLFPLVLRRQKKQTVGQEQKSSNFSSYLLSPLFLLNLLPVSHCLFKYVEIKPHCWIKHSCRSLDKGLSDFSLMLPHV